MKMFTKNAIMAAVGLSLAGVAGAYDVQNNANKSIIWKYHNCVAPTPENESTGSVGDDGTAYFFNRNGGEIPTGGTAAPCYSTGFNTTANPLTAPATLNELTPQIAATLKESQHIDKSGIVLTSDDQTNIYVAADKEVEVWATFLDEGAGYENSVGFFTWSGKLGTTAPNNKPVLVNVDGTLMPRLADGTLLNSERIFLPRTSTTFPIPRATTTGTTVYLGKFNGGKHGLGIGFMIAANAWSGKARGTSPDRGGVNPNREKDWIFYSVKGMNPECVEKTGCNLDQHTILMYDDEVTSTVTSSKKYRRLVMGMEDIKRTGGDHDFNDVLFAIHVHEKDTGAFENLGNIPKMITASGDSDNDGVVDTQDEFPNDPTRAFSRYFPGKTTWGTLAYEDLWPAKGDYDFNDLLMRYKSREILNAKREVVDLELDFRLAATGAGHRNGFAINLPGIAKNTVRTATLTGKRYDTPSQSKDLVAEGKILANPLLSDVTGGQNGSVFEIFKDAKELLHPDLGSGTGSLYNNASCTEPGFRNSGKACGQSPEAEFKLTVNFTTPRSSFPSAPYDPFLFRANAPAPTTSQVGVLGNQVEVHLPGRGPTSRALTSFFGSQIDRTPSALRHTTTDANVLKDSYLSNTKLPWAIHIPVEWNYPYEKLDFTIAYPDVVGWAASGGKENTTWFSRPALNGEYTFKKHAK
jgi:LruC domain-containing protein